MFKKIILSLILLSNVIFTKNEDELNFGIDEFGQLTDKEGYVDPYISYGLGRQEGLDSWGRKWKEAGYGNRWAEDSEGFINPKVYQNPENNKSFFFEDIDRYNEQKDLLNRWDKVWEKAANEENEKSFFGKIKNYIKK